MSKSHNISKGIDYHICKECRKRNSENRDSKNYSIFSLQRQEYSKHHPECQPVGLVDSSKLPLMKRFLKTLKSYDSMGRVQTTSFVNKMQSFFQTMI
uniref:Integrase_SAM-like_N domain-containing protein n=1 Tax=Strongyloides papillosus TaxID=174720 RepID=A0A0N5CE38_STREA